MVQAVKMANMAIYCWENDRKWWKNNDHNDKFHYFLIQWQWCQMLGNFC